MRWVMVLGACAGLAATFGVARAAELEWSAPPGCPDEQAVEALLGTLLERPLSAYERVTVAAAITRGETGEHTLKLEVREARVDDAPTARTLTAQRCEELTQAAALAISMALAEREETAAARPAPRAYDDEVIPALASREAASEQVSPTSLSISASTALDVGTLPSAAFGGQADVGFSYRRFYAVALAAFFPPQSQRAAGAVTLESQLAFGGLLAGVELGREPFAIRAIGGLELGRLAMRGVGLEEGGRRSTRHRALRAQVAFVIAVLPSLRLRAELGVVATLTRPTFSVDGGVLAHQPAAVALRGQLGLEIPLGPGNGSSLGWTQTER